MYLRDKNCILVQKFLIGSEKTCFLYGINGHRSVFCSMLCGYTWAAFAHRDVFKMLVSLWRRPGESFSFCVKLIPNFMEHCLAVLDSLHA